MTFTTGELPKVNRKNNILFNRKEPLSLPLATQPRVQFRSSNNNLSRIGASFQLSSYRVRALIPRHTHIEYYQHNKLLVTRGVLLKRIHAPLRQFEFVNMISNRIVCFGKKKNRELSLIEMQDYLVNWEAGTLGLTFRPELGTELPPVVFQVLNEKSIARFSGVQVGDLLVSINGKKTSFLGYDRAMRRLYKGKLPMMLHFRTPLKNHVLQSQFGANDCTLHHTEERSLPSCSRPGALPMLEDHGPTIEPATENVYDPICHYPEERVRHEDPLYSPTSPARAPTDGTVPGNYRRMRQSSPSEPQTQSSRKKIQINETRQKEISSEKQPKTKKPFKVVWERGNLGMSFCKYREDVPLPMVDFILDDGCNGSPGQVTIGQNIDRVRVGDVLVGINSYKTKRLGFEKSLFLLNSVSKPVILRFISTVSESADKTSACSSELMPDIQLRTDRTERSRTSSRCEKRRNLWGEQGKRDMHIKEDIDGRKHSVAQTSGKADRLHSDVSRERCDTRLSTNRTISASRKEHTLKTQQLPTTNSRVYKSQPHEAIVNYKEKNENVRGDSIKSQMLHEAKKLRQSQVLDNLKQSSSKSPVSLAASMMLIIGMSEEPIDRIKFAGVPLFSIKEGTTEAQLLQVYAQACIAARKKKEHKYLTLATDKSAAPSSQKKDHKHSTLTSKKSNIPSFEAVSARARETTPQNACEGLTVSALRTTPNFQMRAPDKASDRQVDTQSSQFKSTDMSISKPIFNEKESLMHSNSNVAMFALRCADSSKSFNANQVVKIKRTMETSARTDRAISSDFIPLNTDNTVDAARRLSRKVNDRINSYTSEGIRSGASLSDNVSTLARQYTIRSDGCLESVRTDSSSSKVDVDALAMNESRLDCEGSVSISHSTHLEQAHKLKAYLGGHLDRRSETLILQKAALIEEIKILVESIRMDNKSVTEEANETCRQCGNADNGMLTTDACDLCRERFFVCDQSPVSTIDAEFILRTSESATSKSAVIECENGNDLEEVLSDGTYEDDTRETRVSEDDCLLSEELDEDVFDSFVRCHPSQADIFWDTE